MSFVADVPRSPNLPPSFDKTSRTNVLSFDTDAPIVRYLQSDRTAPSASTIYADILVKGQPYPAGISAPEADDDDKILIYSRVSQSGSETNLCVYAKDAADGTAQEIVLTKTIGTDEWHRLVVKATAAGYQVYCDGADAADLCDRCRLQTLADHSIADNLYSILGKQVPVFPKWRWKLVGSRKKCVSDCWCWIA